MERVRGYDHDNHDPKVFKNSEVQRYKTSTGSLDVFSSHLIGKSLTITLINGRIESGILTQFGQYDIEIKAANGKSLIVMKSSIILVTVM
jgi:sRNA-binding regulator protein Hfq